uniref:LysM n=1 Tax=uncultured Xanthomonas sp. TaxID=152831 RepID=A0A060C414_9XANT|nr:LysM [uncultured Xanthomonas sp.]
MPWPAWLRRCSLRPSRPGGSPPAWGTHTVREGESAWGIARRYGLTVQALLAGNGLRAGDILKPGMVLRLKAAGDAR